MARSYSRREAEANRSTSRHLYFTFNTQVFFSPAYGITHGAVDPFENTLTTTIDIPADTPAGMQNVRVVVNEAVEYSGQHLFEVIRTQDAEIVSVDPDSAYAGSSCSLVVTGINTHFGGTPQVEFSGTGITVNSVSFDPAEPDQIEAQISVADDAPLGKRDVTVDAQGVVVTLPEAFTIKLPLFNGGDDNGGCSCGGKSSCSVHVMVGLLGLAFFRRRLEVIIHL